MEEVHYTIGMAGHIDHGKTTLTKALTNIDTDRLKEEKNRSISIELGYAPLHLIDDTQVSIIDVPGHERFIRQMIAGVAGIDLVVLVIAADEGVMPQTKEHLEILEFLGIKRCIIVVSKIDYVDQELLELVEFDITELLQNTIFQDSIIVYVDSLSGKGIEKLKDIISSQLKLVEQRDYYGSFRLPVDQVFTVQGQGTIVRGTIYEGIVRTGSELTVLPSQIKGKARTIQVHHLEVDEAKAGQRTAINLTGLNHKQVHRGDVLVQTDHFIVTDTIDVTLRFVDHLRFPLKQRSPIKLHVGTAEVMGKVIFFDRNVVNEGDQEVLCQLRLDQQVVVRRGDRFIVRRPTPTETIGGGWVINPNGKKYKFGNETIQLLQTKKEGTPEDLILDVLQTEKVLSLPKLIQRTSIDEQQVHTVVGQGLEKGRLVHLDHDKIARMNDYQKIKDKIKTALEDYHRKYPMRLGMNKGELIQSLNEKIPIELSAYVLQELQNSKELKKIDQYISIASFQVQLPKKWKTRMEKIIDEIHNDGLGVEKWDNYLAVTPFSQQEKDDLKNYLLVTNQAYSLTEDLLVHRESLERAIKQLRATTKGTFTLQEAKDILGISRKYLVPLLEQLDKLNITTRNDKVRSWL